MKNKRELSIKNLCIISKVAKRKEVARARLEKTAIAPAAIILAPAAAALFATLYAGYKLVFDMNYENFINAMAAEDFDMASDNFKKLSGIKLQSWVEANDRNNLEEYEQTVASFGGSDSYNFREAYLFAMDKANIGKEEKKEPTAVAPSQSTAKQTPSTTRRAPATDPTARMRALLIEALHNPGHGKGWDQELNNAFLGAYNEWRSFKTLELKDELKESLPEITGGWKTVATQIGFEPNISGAEALVTELISLKKPQGGQASGSEPAAPAAAPGETPVDNTTGAKAKLTELFNMILSGSTKVDRVGIDLRRDTMIFKGVIIGLGGASQAVEYVFSKVRFTTEQLTELTKMSFNSNQKIAINALSPVRNLFVDIRKDSTKGIRNNAFNAASLSRAVTRWLAGQPATPAATPAAPAAATAKESIRKSIEIRKMAARKKLGF